MNSKLLPHVAFLGYLSFCLMACGPSSQEKRTEAVALSFSKTYFNWQFGKAMTYCTPASQKWMRYAASQVHQGDVDLLRALDEGAKCRVKNVWFEAEDSVATALVSIENFLHMDTVGSTAHLVKKANFKLRIVRSDKTWKVELSGLPQEEKHAQ